jgi:hypothetical protein
MGLFRRPKPVAVACVWDGKRWLSRASYDLPADDFFAAVQDELPWSRLLCLTTGEDDCPVLCLDGRAGVA